MNRPSTPLPVHDTTSRCMTNRNNGGPSQAPRERGSGLRLSARHPPGPGGWEVRLATAAIIRTLRRRGSQRRRCHRAR